MSKATFPSLRLPGLFDVQLRVYAKYEVSWADVELAVEYLRCFLDAKARQPGRLIILPQIADWAWHELILDTARYRQVCARIYGRLLSHVATEDPAANLRAVFEESMETMRRDYGLGLGERPQDWLDAGWDSPRYRLRVPLVHETSGAGPAPRLDEVAAGLLSWLPGRLVRRFGVPEAAARRGVLEHLAYLQAPDRPGTPSVLRQIAWQEHILWTDRYAADCNRLLGHFLDHDRPESGDSDTLSRRPPWTSSRPWKRSRSSSPLPASSWR
jgi:hypothetical protein